MVEEPALVRSSPRRMPKYSAVRALPTCSNMPMDEMASKRSLAEVPVVLQPDLHPVGHPGLLRPAAGPRRLLLADRDADDLGPWCVAAWMAIDPQPQPTSSRRVPGPLVEAELAADQLVLVRLRLARA